MVLGSTGSLGRHVLDGLVARGRDPKTITAVGRNTTRLAELADAGFTTAALELSDAASVARHVSAHRDIVLISGSDPSRLSQHRSVIEAAKTGGVQHV